ncbi:MAG: Rpn family recombination-promoting nuclease/putative transposase [Erysipelotrichaceae bacterium]|nr:Rpn family recombination-promoting nuclease/putative transposase [Erysipelotrichaceae bacterium]
MNLQDYKLNLRNDYVFKMLHYTDQKVGKEIFASIVEAFTGLKAESVTFAPTDLYAFDPAGKDVRYDLNAKINLKNAVDLEMQVHHMDAVPDRAGYYAAMLYVNQNNKGEEYDVFVNVQSIFLCAHDVYPNLEGCCHEFVMKDNEYGVVLTEKMKAHIIELNKGIRKIEQSKRGNSLSLQEKWMLFLMKYEENTQDSIVLKLLEEEIFRKAKEVLHMISEDARVRERAFARERFIRDQAQMRKENERILKTAKVKFEEAERMTKEAESKTKEAEAKRKEAEIKAKEAEAKTKEADEKMNLANEIIKETSARVFKEKDESIVEMLKDGVSDSLIMKYLHCSQQQIDEVKKKL